MIILLKILIPITLMIAVKYDALRDRHMKDIYMNSRTYNDNFRGWTERILFPILAAIFGSTWQNWTYGQQLWHMYKELSMFSLYILISYVLIWLYNFAWYSFVQLIVLAFICSAIWNYFYGSLK